MDKIFLTRPLLPNINDYQKKIKEIFESQWLTNMGKKHNELEQKIKDELNLPNGSEVITTPFTFVATLHCINIFIIYNLRNGFVIDIIKCEKDMMSCFIYILKIIFLSRENRMTKRKIR